MKRIRGEERKGKEKGGDRGGKGTEKAAACFLSAFPCGSSVQESRSGCYCHPAPPRFLPLDTVGELSLPDHPISTGSFISTPGSPEAGTTPQTMIDRRLAGTWRLR